MTSQSLHLTRKALSGEGDFGYCEREEKSASSFPPWGQNRNVDGIKPTVERGISEQGASLIVPDLETASSLLKDLSVWK